MKICTFFGHKDSPQDIEPLLFDTLCDLIEKKNVERFYVGNQGNYDSMVIKTLSMLKIKYPQIKYEMVLAYLNEKSVEMYNTYNTIYPEGLENVPKRFAISKRNGWMIDKSDYVVTYVKYRTGEAARFKELAEKKGKVVINIADK